MNRQRVFLLGCAAAVTAASLSGCFGNDEGSAVPVPPSTGATQSVNFSQFAYTTYEQPANSTPVNFDTTVFVYDADNDPAAFSGLFM